MKRPGHLKIYVGYAAGVGKTYRMLDEAQTLRAQGVDVVVAYFETHRRKETIAKSEGLEFVPRRVISYAGSRFEEMDTEAVLRRKPALLLVDEYAHSNAPGWRHPKRWQDVAELLDAGIDVWTTLNVQHLESLVDVVWKITGVRQRETVPDTALARADEIELIDITPAELRQRMERGQGLCAGEYAAWRRTTSSGPKQPDRPARNGPAPGRPDGRRKIDRAAPRRAHPHLPHRQPLLRLPHPPRQANGGLLARRLSRPSRRARSGRW